MHSGKLLLLYLVDSPIQKFIKKVTTLVQDVKWIELIQLEEATEKTNSERIE